MPEIVCLSPSSCANRHQDADSVYHLYNRVAHSVRFLEDVEKGDLLDRIRRVSGFCGIKPLSWCLMTNHFHLLVYLPYPQSLPREEIERRLELLRPDERAVFRDGFILDRAPQTVLGRMFHVGMFMKIVKENFTLAYNARSGHHGTMWEGPYRFKKIPMTERDLSSAASYQNLNPIRACMANDFTGYPWTSFAAASKGDALALSGLDFIFGGFLTRTDVSDRSVRPPDELLGLMREKMDRDLESHLRDRAVEVWRKRLAGQSVEKADPLTSEAMLAQVQARMDRLMSEEFHLELSRRLGRGAKTDELRVVRAMAMSPAAKTSELARIANMSESRVKRLSIMLQRQGILEREGTRRRSFWKFSLPI